MGQKMYIKPGKNALKAGMIVSALFFLFGIFFILLLIGEPESYIGIGFLIFWLIVIGLIFRTYYVQFVNYDQTNPGDFNPMINIESESNSNISSTSFDEKLRKLDQLKKDGLLSDIEYEQKRKEVMEEKW